MLKPRLQLRASFKRDAVEMTLPPFLRLKCTGGLFDDMRGLEQRFLIERPADELQAKRQARIERNFVITTCLRDTMRRFAEWLRFLALWTLRLARDLAVERLVRSAIRELHQLDATRALVRLL